MIEKVNRPDLSGADTRVTNGTDGILFGKMK
jgi:hypothetical protein